MKVLLTGADGFLGQHAVRTLLDRGHEVVGAIREPPPRLTTLPGDEADRVTWLAFDLLDRDSVYDLVHSAAPDAVLHLAGVASVGRSWREPERTLAINATGSLHMLMAIRDLPSPVRPRPILLAGSGEAYGREGTEEDPLLEDLPLLPLNPYGASKAAQEALGWALARTDDIRLVQIRSFQQIGPGQSMGFVIPDWAAQLVRIRRDDLPRLIEVGNLDIVRDFLDVRDGVTAYADMLESDQARGAYNVCSGRGSSLVDILTALQRITGLEVEVQVRPELLRPVEIHSLVGSNEKLRSATGWLPRYTLEETLRDVAEYCADPPNAAAS